MTCVKQGACTVGNIVASCRVGIWSNVAIKYNAAIHTPTSELTEVFWSESGIEESIMILGKLQYTGKVIELNYIESVAVYMGRHVGSQVQCLTIFWSGVCWVNDLCSLLSLMLIWAIWVLDWIEISGKSRYIGICIKQLIVFLPTVCMYTSLTVEKHLWIDICLSVKNCKPSGQYI